MRYIDPYEVAALNARRAADSRTVAAYPWYPLRGLMQLQTYGSRQDGLRVKGKKGGWVAIPTEVLDEMTWVARDRSAPFRPRPCENGPRILLRLAREINLAAERVVSRDAS